MDEINALLEQMEMGAHLYALIVHQLDVQRAEADALKAEVVALRADVKVANTRYSELLYKFAEVNRGR